MRADEEQKGVGSTRFPISATEPHTPRPSRAPRRRPAAHSPAQPRPRDAPFLVNADYTGYLHWPGAALEQVDCALHAHAVMIDHVHLLLTSRRAAAPWDSGYSPSAIQADSYLLACQRHIELNPVGAAMVGDTAHYR
jgi:putative transposase